MRYLSTRNKNIRITASEAIAQGLARDGGLFVPEVLPSISNTLGSLCEMSYKQRAVYILSAFLDEFSTAELNNYVELAYSSANFDSPAVAPLRKLDDSTYFLELWHGPTCAFKDMALQLMPYLFTASLAKTGEKKKVCILVATSGDTGKAALEGFKDVDGTSILVFYPENGVSDIQQLQMVTQTGGNVGVCAVKGNFDDAQNGVKRIFSDEQFRAELEEKGYFLSSANSINWGRLLPQIVYYVSSYCELVRNGRIALGEKINVAVPTGNFGNILAAYYAKKMGLPIKKLICASNENNVLTDFIDSGVYNKNREFFTTISPSMDILVSSNLERLLFELSDKDDALVADYMKQLSEKGSYEISDMIKQRIDADFWGGYCDDEKTKMVINAVFKKYAYLIDTHTAVGYDVLNHYRFDTGDNTVAIVASTANPFKFSADVLSAIGGKASGDGLELIDKLAEASGAPAPSPLSGLRERKIRFTDVTEKEDMIKVVKNMLS